MLNEPKFLKCTICRTMIETLSPQCCDELTCCGRPMELIKPNELITLEEKHLPVIKRGDGCIIVCVGRLLHPMSREHNIMWVEAKTKYSHQRVNLKTGDDPIVTFRIPDRVPVSVYAYCNLHGLWKSSL